MKKIFLFALAGLLLTSCKKSNLGNAVPHNAVTATINGIAYTFNKQVTDTVVTTNGNSIVIIEASADTTADACQVFFVFESDPASIEKEYDVQSGLEVSIGPGNATNAGLYMDVYSALHPFTLDAVTITPTTIRGTFGGTLFLNGDTASTQAVVTNGQFNFNK